MASLFGLLQPEPGGEGVEFEDEEEFFLLRLFPASTFVFLKASSFSVFLIGMGKDASNFATLFGGLSGDVGILLRRSSVWNVLFKWDLNLSHFFELAIDESQRSSNF